MALKSRAVGVAAAFVIAAVMVVGCGEDETTPTVVVGQVKQVITACIEFDSLYYDNALDTEYVRPGIDLFGLVMGSPMPWPTGATIGGIAAAEFSAEWDDGECIWYDGWVQQSPQGSKTVAVTTDQGTLQGTVTLPGQASFTSPADGDSIDATPTVTLRWTGSSPMYQVWWESALTGSNWDWSDTVTSATSITILLPATAYRIYAGVWPYAGQECTPGAIGNMTGEGAGFLVAYGEEDEVDLYVRGRSANKTLVAQPKPEISREMRLRKLVERLTVQ